MPSLPFPVEKFDDVLAANEQHHAQFSDSGLTGHARQGLAIITCMDSRINPLAVVGMQAGDIKILRNAGARVTDDVLRTLVLATYLLGVSRVLVMPHTDCRMAAVDEASIHRSILEEFNVDTRSVRFETVNDQRASLARDVAAIRTHPLLPSDLTVGGMIYDVHTGRLEAVDC